MNLANIVSNIGKTRVLSCIFVYTCYLSFISIYIHLYHCLCSAFVPVYLSISLSCAIGNVLLRVVVVSLCC